MPMNKTFIFAALVFTQMALANDCPETRMVNVSKWNWDQHDKETLISVKSRCEQLYSDASCLKVFRKFGKQDYSVICGTAGPGESDVLFPNAQKESEIRWQNKSKLKKETLRLIGC